MADTAVLHGGSYRLLYSTADGHLAFNQNVGLVQGKAVPPSKVI